MSSFYERYWSRGEDELSDFNLKWPKLAPLVPREGNITILDFGCGKGHILSEIARLNPTAKLIGLDVSEKALAAAREKVAGVDFKKIEDGVAFPLPDASVDFIFSSEVIEHVYDTENAFRELARVLRPGGTMLMTAPFHGLLKNFAIVLFGFDRHFDPAGPHVRFFTRKSLTGMMEKAGFRVISHGYYGRFYPFPHSIFVLAERVSS